MKVQKCFSFPESFIPKFEEFCKKKNIKINDAVEEVLSDMDNYWGLCYTDLNAAHVKYTLYAKKELWDELFKVSEKREVSMNICCLLYNYCIKHNHDEPRQEEECEYITTSVRVKKDELEIWKEQAKNKDLSLGEYIRKAVMVYVHRTVKDR